MFCATTDLDLDATEKRLTSAIMRATAFGLRSYLNRISDYYDELLYMLDRGHRYIGDTKTQDLADMLCSMKLSIYAEIYRRHQGDKMPKGTYLSMHRIWD